MSSAVVVPHIAARPAKTSYLADRPCERVGGVCLRVGRAAGSVRVWRLGGAGGP